MDAQRVQLSKFLSRVLRHSPGTIGLTLDPQGWAEVDALLATAQRHGVQLDEATLRRIVAENDKQRFALSADGQRIRASQGHSLVVLQRADMQRYCARPDCLPMSTRRGQECHGWGSCRAARSTATTG